jgi:peptidase M48-like protein
MGRLMNLLRPLFLWFLLLLTFRTHSLALQASRPAEGACSMPSFSNIVNDPNIFSEQQEEWMGEILDPQIRKRFHVIRDPENDFLQKVGARLLAQLPPTQMHYSFTIIDLPDNNAFGIPGGRIYLSRRIISLARNEDELAGLLGHEIGHIVTRQTGIDLTREFKAVLGVTEVGDRKDVMDKWNRLLDIAAKKNQKRSERRERQEQLIADRMALYAMTRAGYNPSAFADFFDRLAQTKGNTGNFWSDLFGATSAESKRLRELVRNAAPLPGECIAPLAEDTAPRFLKWQKEVVESAFAVAAEELPGLERKISLDPPLRADLDQLQFSPDGKYLLAQDAASIFLLTRSPLRNLFRIDAPDATPAQFTPDSRFVVFSDKELRVEKWDLEARQRAQVHQVVLPFNCQQNSLSPNGDILACLTSAFELHIIQVATNKTLFTRKDFFQPDRLELFVIELLRALNLESSLPLFQMQFSPNARYLLLAHGETSLAYDARDNIEIKLPKSIKSIVGDHFVFKPGDEIAGFDRDGGKARLNRLRFPSGELVDRFPLPVAGKLAAAARGDYLMILNSGNAKVGIIDLKKRQATIGFQVSGVAIFDDSYAAETQGGAVALLSVADGKTVDGTRLPYSPLQSAKVSGFSSDSRWLAISGPSRGAIWNLETGKRTAYVLGFVGALFEKESLITSIPRHQKEDAQVVQFDTSGASGRKLYDLEPPGEDKPRLAVDPVTYATLKALDTDFFQFGPLLIKIEARPKSEGGLSMVVCDVHTNKKIWEQGFSRGWPQLFYTQASDTLAMVMDYQHVDTRDDPALKARLESVKNKSSAHDAYVIKVVEAQSGKPISSVVVDTGQGSFRVRSVLATRESLLVRDSDGRTLVYSLKSGEQTGRVFGSARAVSAAGDRMVVEAGAAELDLYDLKSLDAVAHYTFASRVVSAEFSDNDKTLLVLTGDQAVYKLNLNSAAQEASSK